MTLAELKKILDLTGFPVAYSHFRTEPSFPYLTFLTTHTKNFIADNRVYKKIENIQIDLYTDDKDVAAENVLEDVLFAHSIVWSATETYIETENMYQRSYDIQI